MTTLPYAGFVGIDIAAKTFTATWVPAGPARPRQFDQSTHGYEMFDQHLRAALPPSVSTLVVMEATGSYWIALAVWLHDHGYHVAVINPAQIANFSPSLPRRPKTDPHDSLLLRQFAQERQPNCWTPPPTVYHEVRQRLVARDALMEMRQQARNQRHALAQWPVHVAPVLTQFTTIIADFDTRIAELDRAIAQVLTDGRALKSRGHCSVFYPRRLAHERCPIIVSRTHGNDRRCRCAGRGCTRSNHHGDEDGNRGENTTVPPTF